MAPGGPEGSGGDAHRVALVHDFLVDVRGAERVFAAMTDLWPQADLLHRDLRRGRDAGPLRRPRRPHVLPPAPAPDGGDLPALLPLYPKAMEHLDLGGYDLVVSSSVPGPTACGPGGRPARLLLPQPVPLRVVGRRARRRASGRVLARRSRRPSSAAPVGPAGPRRVTRYLANSETTRRGSAGLRPRRRRRLPAGGDAALRPGRVGEHFLIVSELMAQRTRRPCAFTRLGASRDRRRRPGGPPAAAPRGAHRPLRRSRQRRRGRVAMRSAPGARRHGGRGVRHRRDRGAGVRAPVLAADAGGVRETVLEGRTGAFFAPGDADALEALLRSFDPAAVDPGAGTANAARFSVARFGRELTAAVESARTATRRSSRLRATMETIARPWLPASRPARYGAAMVRKPLRLALPILVLLLAWSRRLGRRREAHGAAGFFGTRPEPGVPGGDQRCRPREARPGLWPGPAWKPPRHVGWRASSRARAGTMSR